MSEDAIAFLKVFDTGAEMQDFSGDVLAKNERVRNSETVISGWRVADLPVDGAGRNVSII